MQPGTYFNPQTEVVVVVDDSPRSTRRSSTWRPTRAPTGCGSPTRSRSTRTAATAPRDLPDPLPPRLRRLGLRNRARAGRRGARRGRGRPGARPRGLSGRSAEGRDRRPTSRCPTRTATRSRSPTCAGETVVLYFYPRADTPGCTTQACGIRDRGADYAAAGRAVLGVSPDEPRRAEEVRRQARPRLHPARRHRPRGRRRLRRLGREVDVRQEVHGHAALDLHHRRRRQDRARSSPRSQPKKHDGLVLKALAELADT